MPQQCNSMAGHSDCAAHVLRTHFNKDKVAKGEAVAQNGCPGGCVTCISRYKQHPEAVPSRAVMFMEDPAAALRYCGHSKNERRKRKMPK